MSGQEPLVSAQQFGYRYHRDDPWVLRDLNIHLDRGEWLLVAGASGSGKSTFARVLNGTIPHFYGGQIAGTLAVCGIDPADTPMSTTFRRVGCLFQDPVAQLFGGTVERELSFGLESLGLPASEVHTQVMNIARSMGIFHLLHRMPQTLSGGEQQLVLLAAFLALAPQLLVLDEPLSMLDARARQRIFVALQEAHSHGIGLFIIDHQLDTYGAAPTRVALMEGGTVSLQRTPTEVGALLLQKPESAVAPPAVALWWGQYVLSLLKSHNGGDMSVPLSIETAQKQLERLPVAVLRDMYSLVTLALCPEKGVQPCAKLLSVGQAPSVEWNNVNYTYPSGERESRLKNKHKPTVLVGKALHDVSAVLRPCEIVALLGPNGAGKSTLLRTLNGLIRPQSGEVRICGKRAGTRPVAELAHVVGYAPQRPERLFFCSTVAEELAIGPRALGMNATTKAAQSSLIEAFDLGSLLDRSPYTLSVGEQRRVGLASVLASQPQVIALDEPTAGLDASARAALAVLLRGLANQGAVVVMVTHDIEFAAATASRWLVLIEGQLVADDVPVQIMSKTDILKEAALEPSVGYQLEYWLHQRLLKEDTLECEY